MEDLARRLDLTYIGISVCFLVFSQEFSLRNIHIASMDLFIYKLSNF